MKILEKIYNCKLTRISSNHDAVRTDEVIGWCEELPVEGKPFHMQGPPLYSGDLRDVETTTIVSTKATNWGEVEFHTANSHYKFELLYVE